jgi:hypothetical protein
VSIVINKVGKKVVKVQDCPTKVIVVDEGAQGPIGPTGPVGPPGPPSTLAETFIAKRTAQGSIGGQRAVIGNADGSVSYADTTNITHAGQVLGITLNAANDTEEITIIRAGLMSFEGWSWDETLPVYLAENGLLSQNASVLGFSQIVGFAESPTDLFVNLREPIILT